MRLALLLLAGCGAAATLPPPKLAPALEGSRWFVGQWVGKSRAISGKETTLRWTVTPSLGGAWLEGHAVVVELGVEARDFVSVSGGGLVRVYVDAQGTHFVLRSPAGWEGTTLRWEGEGRTADGNPVRVRETVERVDGATLHARWEIFAGGDWSPLSEETLHRVGPGGSV